MMIIIATTVKAARNLARSLDEPCCPTSPRAIRHYGAARGLTNITYILNCSGQQLGPRILAVLDPYRKQGAWLLAGQPER